MTTAVATSDIRANVRRVFNRVAEAPTDSFRFGVGASLARQVGYPDSVLGSLPAVAVESFTGLANLHPYLTLQPGEKVLDLGSGAGLDALLAARSVGPTGAVVGLDGAEAMVAKARHVATLVAAQNVTFEHGQAEAMPLHPDTFDAAHVNGIFNLCPDKPPVARELFRVLKPGGRAIVAEITYTDARPAVTLKSADDWFR
jgi:arsenite methyltransferase